MQIFELHESTIETLRKEPETGMGYQMGAMTSPTGATQSGFVIAGAYFVPEESDDLQGMQLARDFSKLLVLDPITSTTSVGARYRISLTPPAGINQASLSALAAAAPRPAFPPHVATTGSNDVFYRLSSFQNDRRVLPNGSLVPQSYSTTDTDITVVPSGLAGVGRYALPSRVSARYSFEIKPGAGVQILFGTVTPNFGLAGGGVEVYFPNGTGPGTVTVGKTLSEK